MKTSITYALLLATVCSAASSSYAGFQSFGQLPGGDRSWAARYSINSGIVLGFASVDGDATTVMWTRANGLQPLAADVSAYGDNYGVGISDDGTTIVSDGQRASFVWSAENGITDLGTFDGGSNTNATGMSADGAYVIGYGTNSSGESEAFVWTPEDGVQGLGFLNPAVPSSRASAITPDGSVIVGRSNGAFRWSASTGMVSLNSDDNEMLAATAQAVSDSGQWIVGQTYSGAGLPANQAYRWSEDTGIQRIGTLSGDDFSWATAISGDGSQIAIGTKTDDGVVASIWDETNGERLLIDILRNDYGFALNGWEIELISGIYNNGKTFTGAATNPEGLTEGFIETIPAPSGVILASCGVACHFRRRRA